LHVAETWNNAGTTFTAAKVDITNTNSAADSKLLDLQVGGVSQATVRKNGDIVILGALYTDNGNSSLSATALRIGNSNGEISLSSGNLVVPLATGLGWNNTLLFRDGADNTLALRNSTATQTFRVYNTYTNASNYERLRFNHDGVQFSIGSESAGSGVAQSLRIHGPSNANLDFATGVSFRNATGAAGYLTVGASGVTFPSDNTYDIGASGASRPRNVYVGTSLVVGASDGVTGSVTVGIGASKGIIFGNRGQIGAVGDGVFGFVDFAGTSFSRLQLGPNSDAAPAIARDGAGIKFTGAAAGLTSHIKVPAVAVASLPAAATAGVGARAFVNDASTPVFGSAVSGGGAVAVPVYSTGSAWNVG